MTDAALDYLREKDERKRRSASYGATFLVAIGSLMIIVENPESFFMGLTLWIAVGCLALFVPRDKDINIRIDDYTDLIGIPLLGGILWLAVFIIYATFAFEKVRNAYDRT